MCNDGGWNLKQSREVSRKPHITKTLSKAQFVGPVWRKGAVWLYLLDSYPVGNLNFKEFVILGQLTGLNFKVDQDLQQGCCRAGTPIDDPMASRLPAARR